MGAKDWAETVGYAEFASGAYWMNTRSATVSFDWLAYGDETNMVPEPRSLAALGIGLLGAVLHSELSYSLAFLISCVASGGGS